MLKRLLALALFVMPLAMSGIQYVNESAMIPAYIPTGTTAVVSQTVYLSRLYVANRHVSAITVTLTDRSANCGGAGCQLVPTVSVPANSVYVLDMQDIPAVNGFTWATNTATIVVGWVYYRW